MAADRIPDRVRWAIQLLDVQPGDRVLEAGCGPGVSVALLAGLVGPEGQVVALDRSPTAIARTRARVEDRGLAGRVALHQLDLAAYDGPAAGVDIALAVNVNVFWTTPAAAECAVLRRVVRPGGLVHLVYDAPSAGGTRDIADAVAAALRRHDIDPTVLIHPEEPLTAITGRVPGRPAG